MNPFEITGDDIQKLNDTDLRNLIGMLCEADFRRGEKPASGIRYGGNQDAKDGGIDVMIETDEEELAKTSFVPRKTTGFQVKKPAMSASGIKSEMRPKGKLRPKIVDLIKERGAYIIVSSGSSLTETMYKNRLKSMTEAILDQNGFEDLHVDFLDRGRIATWVRVHPSMILWLRQKIGREVPGWQPYDNWSKAPGGINEEYIFDEKLRLHDESNAGKDSISIVEGISSLRNKLSKPGSSVRLAGLSGVGKTRLAQALFDARIGSNALNPSLVYYTDISDSPQPTPAVFAAQLSQTNQKSILIIDNCPP